MSTSSSSGGIEEFNAVAVTPAWCTEVAHTLARYMRCRYMRSGSPLRGMYRSWLVLPVVKTAGQTMDCHNLAFQILLRLATRPRPSNRYEMQEDEFRVFVHVLPYGVTVAGRVRFLVEILDEFSRRPTIVGRGMADQ